MKVTPYKERPRPPRVSLLTSGGGFLMQDGSIVTSYHLPHDVQAWTDEATALELLRAGKGKALCWRGRPIRYNPDASDERGFFVRVMGVPFPPDPDEGIIGLAHWRDWLAVYGAAPQGSLGGTSMSLLRASLDREFWTGVGAVPPLSFTIGGRQELGPRGAPAEYVGDLRHFDLRAAYATILGGLEYGGQWYRVHADNLAATAELLAQGGRMVFVRARVKLTGSARIGPLIRRPRAEPKTVFGYLPEYPTAGTIQGVWTYPELEAALETGAAGSARILDAWFHASAHPDPYPFKTWFDRVERGRRMHGFAGLLAKATGNALWGQFCISPQGRKQVLYYTRSGRRVMTELRVRGGRKPAHDLSEYLTGTVRAALFRFALEAGERLCSAHTDGGWCDCTGGWHYPDWRQKERASRLRVLDPQVLAYRELRGDVERYVVSGWPADAAAERFESEWTDRTERRAA